MAEEIKNNCFSFKAVHLSIELEMISWFRGSDSITMDDFSRLHLFQYRYYSSPKSAIISCQDLNGIIYDEFENLTDQQTLDLAFHNNQSPNQNDMYNADIYCAIKYCRNTMLLTMFSKNNS